MNKIVLPNFIENYEFVNLEAKRQYEKIILALTFNIFSDLGFNEGIAGHITLRDSIYPNLFWVNPFGMHFSLIEPEDLILVDWNGKIVEGKHTKVNLSAFIIHSSIHKTRNDVNAIVHAHSLYGRVWSTTGRLIEPVVIESTPFYNDHALFDDVAGVTCERDEGELLAKKLGSNKAIILKNHGHLTVGKTIEEAAWWFIAFERAAQIQILSESIGKPLSMNPIEAQRGYNELGNSVAAQFQFQPILEKKLSENFKTLKKLQKCFSK